MTMLLDRAIGFTDFKEHIVKPLTRINILITLMFCLTGLISFPVGADTLSDDILLSAIPPDGETSTKTNLILKKDELSLEDLQQIASLNNPELESLRYEIASIDGRILQVRLNPNPSIGFEAGDMPVKSPGEATWKISYNQPILKGKIKSAGILVGEMEKKAAQLSYQASEREILGEVQTVYFELISLRESLKLYDELIIKSQETVNIANIRFEVLAATETEVIKAKLEVDELVLGKRQLESSLDSISKRLSSFCGIEIPVSKVTGNLNTEFPSLDPDKLKKALTEDHPLMLGAQAKVDVAQASYNLAVAEKNPSYDVSFSYGHNFGSEESIIEAGIEIPLTVNDKNQGNIEEASKHVEASKSQIAVVENELVSEIADAHTEYISACNELVFLEDAILPAAIKAYDMTLLGYQYGKASFLDILEAQRTLFATHLFIQESKKNANLALSGLKKIGGNNLDQFLKGEIK